MTLRLVTEAPPALSPRERLAEAVERAIQGCGGSIDRAIASLSAEVERDGALARVAFEQTWSLVIANIVRRAVSFRGGSYQRHEPRTEDDLAAPARPVAATAGPAVRTVDASRVGAGGAPGSAETLRSAVQPLRGGDAREQVGGAAGRPRPAQRVRSAAALVAVAKVAASILDSHKTELGRPLGDCSRADLVDLAARSRRRGAFYAELAERMPEDGTVRDHCPAADVDQLWARVGMANADTAP